MRAIVIKKYGGPEVLNIERRPDPEPTPDQVLVEVKAFGLNHAECYFRSGAWGDVAEITGIECAGIVRTDPGGQFEVGEKVVAIVGGLGRTLNGSYAELVAVPRGDVAAVKTDLAWDELAAIPESFATAWTALIGVLELKAGQTVVVRGATSALGQAAVNIARQAGARVIGTTRKAERAELLLARRDPSPRSKMAKASPKLDSPRRTVPPAGMSKAATLRQRACSSTAVALDSGD